MEVGVSAPFTNLVSIHVLCLPCTGDVGCSGGSYFCSELAGPRNHPLGLEFGLGRAPGQTEQCGLRLEPPSRACAHLLL